MRDPRPQRDPGARPRPAHLRWGFIGLVALGGGLGTGAREALGLVLPSTGAFPIAIFLVNVTGAFALGVLLDVLLRHGPDHGIRRSLRLLLGTGFMGGYTTYSTLAVGTGQSVISGHPVVGIVYAGVSVVVGAAAAFAGVIVAGELHRRHWPDRRRRS